MPTTYGTTKKSVFFLPSHGLHISAPAAVAIKQGTPLKLVGATGKWTPLTAGGIETDMVGVAAFDAAVDEECTAIVKGTCVLNALSSAATQAGPVEYVDNAVNANGDTVQRFVTSTGVTKTVGYALDVAAGANVAIRVLIW